MRRGVSLALLLSVSQSSGHVASAMHAAAQTTAIESGKQADTSTSGVPVVLAAKDFSDATLVTASVHGFGGVLYLHWPDSAPLVLKSVPDACELVSVPFISHLCRYANVSCPRHELLSLKAQRGRMLREAVASLTTASESRVNSIRERVLESGNTHVLLMEFVTGGMPLATAQSAHAQLEDPGIAASMGRITAVDMLLNNWDRLPLPIAAWRPDPHGMFAAATPGNLDNLLRRSDGELVAIDTDMKRTYPDPTVGEDDYLGELATIFSSIRSGAASGEVSEVVRGMSNGLMLKGVAMESDAPLLAFQSAVVNAMCSLDGLDLDGYMHREALREVGLEEEPLSAQLVARAQRILHVWRASSDSTAASTTAPASGNPSPTEGKQR